jgi:hypothetical protein
MRDMSREGKMGNKRGVRQERRVEEKKDEKRW